MAARAELLADILIVGGGSRALLVLERLAAAAATRPNWTLRVVIADPGPLGPGVHDIDQPPYLIFNSPNSCPTMFVDRRVSRLDSAIPGKSFKEWLDTGEGDRTQDFQSRAVAGRYLSWAARHLITNLPPNLQVEHLRRTVVAATSSSSGRLNFEAEGPVYIRPRAAVLAVGHSVLDASEEFAGLPTASPQAEIIARPFPLRTQLANVGEGQVIAVRGLGLTALDVLAELTIGRGGRFESHTAGLRYVPSGREPSIYLYSRSSCPIRARPEGSFGGSSPFVPTILTAKRAADLLRDDQPVEFRTQVFPLILAEMALRLLRGHPDGSVPDPLATVGRWFDEGGARRSNAEVCGFFQLPHVQDALLALLRPVLCDGVPGTRVLAMKFLRDDIRDSQRGLAGSPLKYAIEALIDARVFVKQVIDFRHDRLIDPQFAYRTFSSLVNRNTIGPQPRKSEEFLALLECGLAEIAPGGSSVTVQRGELLLTGPGLPEGTAVDRLICADHLNLARPEQAAFIRSLLSAGLALPVRGDDQMLIGLKVDRHMRLVPSNPKAGFPIWAIGPICDGSAYYNNYLPCIQPDAEFPYFEADRIARSLCKTLGMSPNGGRP
jgi:FAD-NAD(P)-binding